MVSLHEALNLRFYHLNSPEVVGGHVVEVAVLVEAGGLILNVVLVELELRKQSVLSRREVIAVKLDARVAIFEDRARQAPELTVDGCALDLLFNDVAFDDVVRVRPAHDAVRKFRVDTAHTLQRLVDLRERVGFVPAVVEPTIGLEDRPDRVGKVEAVPAKLQLVDERSLVHPDARGEVVTVARRRAQHLQKCVAFVKLQLLRLDRCEQFFRVGPAELVEHPAEGHLSLAFLGWRVEHNLAFDLLA